MLCDRDHDYPDRGNCLHRLPIEHRELYLGLVSVDDSRAFHVPRLVVARDINVYFELCI